MAASTSSQQYFQNLRKVSSQFFVKTMWSKFQQNRSKNVEIKGPDRNTCTHIHTHTQTGIVLGQQIQSFHELTEYKNHVNIYQNAHNVLKKGFYVLKQSKLKSNSLEVFSCEAEGNCC